MQADTPHLAHHFEDLQQQHAAATLGMWAFLATEILFFGSVLTGYTVYRSQYAEQFQAMSERLRLDLATINTVVLICSSLTVVLALHAAKIGRKNLVPLFLGATLALGAAFLGIKFYEYYVDYREHLIPGYNYNPDEWPERLARGPGELFMTFYFILTGLHAVHMLVGMGVLVWVLAGALRGRYSAKNFTAVEVFGLYWHFVDIVWIFLFPLLYLVRH